MSGQTVVVVVAAVAVLMVVGGQQQLLDYEYFPHVDNQPVSRTNAFRAPRPFREEQEAKLHKCRCDGNQVWDGTGCRDTPTYVAVMDPDTGLVVAFNTSKFGSVTVGLVQCPKDHLLAKLEPQRSYNYQFSLLSNGTLYWHQVQYEHYCIDHTLDEEGKATSWEARVCLPPPAVPRCCPPGSALGADGSCFGHSNQLFSPAVTMAGVPVEWPEQVAGDTVSVKCKNYEKMKTFPLDNSEARLKYMSGGVSLVWSPTPLFQKEQREGYCVGAEAGREGYVATACSEDQEETHQLLCSDATCVRKCCSEKEIVEGTDCVAAESDAELWKPSFSDADNPASSVEPPEDLVVVHGLPHCSSFPLQPQLNEDDAFYLLRNGSLFVPTYSESYLPTQYCVENFRNYDSNVYTQALLCFPEKEETTTFCSVVKTIVYPVLLLVSSVFLGLTLLVYLSVPDLRVRLHGRCLISLVSALFVGYVLMATAFLTKSKLTASVCSSLASVTHLSLLAAFFWLNVMCFDIWRTLRKARTIAEGGRFAHRRFLLYSLYSWGCPLLITIAALVVDKLPHSYNVIRPNFSRKCWFEDNKAMWLYLYGWVLLLAVANITFFGLVARILVKAQNDPLLRRTRQQNRERMWLYVKLFLVMGVTWLADVVSWQTNSCGAWILTDAINALQGLTIFLVFVCKKNIRRKVKEMCGRCCGQAKQLVLHPSTTFTTSFSSSSSSSSSRKRQSNISGATNVKTSPSSTRTVAAALSLQGSNANPPVPLQTLQEAPNEQSEPLHGGAGHEQPPRDRPESPEASGQHTPPLRDSGGDATDGMLSGGSMPTREAGAPTETTPLRLPDSTPQPSPTLSASETHF